MYDMESLSFRDLLKQKMGQNQPTNDACKNPSTPLPESISELSHEFFFLSVRAPLRSPLKAYPRPSPAKAKVVEIPLKKFMEKRVKKIQLDEVSLGKWHLFEKIVGQKFGDDLGKSEVLSVFRSFLKRVHPDLSANTPQVDFAFLVKAKDELIAVIELDRP